MTKKFRSINTGGHDGWKCVKFCLLFNLSPCARYCLLIGSQLTTWSQGNLHYIGLHFFQLDREFFCLLPSLTRLYSAAASPSVRLRSDGSLAIILSSRKYHQHLRKYPIYVTFKKDTVYLIHRRCNF